jgi:hypothetical protein
MQIFLQKSLGGRQCGDGPDLFVGQKFLSSGESECRTKKFSSGRCFLHLCISNENDPNPKKESHPNLKNPNKSNIFKNLKSVPKKN